MKRIAGLCFLLILSLAPACDNETDPPPPPPLQLFFVRVGPADLKFDDPSANDDMPADKPIVAGFSAPLDKTSAANAIKLLKKDTDTEVPLTLSYLDNDKTVSALPDEPLAADRTYSLQIGPELRGASGESFAGITTEFKTVAGSIAIASISIDGQNALNSSRILNVPVQGAEIDVTFSVPVDPTTVSSSTIKVAGANAVVPASIALNEENTALSFTIDSKLKDLWKYQFTILSDVKGANGENFTSYTRSFYTGTDPTPDHPTISTDELLTLVQQQTFRYFWDFAQPASGMARERNTSGDLVTSGGSGFGIMAIIVGIERNFITRAEGIERLDRILDFLESADRFHGAWSHWINGNTGDVIPFSSNDNGGDLVETSFLMQGLLTFRQYLNAGDPQEAALIDRINALWETVEWDWYTQDGQHVLYWHWSPDKAWIMNHPIRGYNEALITYVLAASSPTHTIDADVYHEGWANNGGIVNGKSFYDITLPVGYDYGGPLFFTHYSFLGLDPRNLLDAYANYWTQNVNHSLINHAYCADNPRNYVGYSDENWGLTASDNQNGYSAHSPTNDLGVITPTAALSSMPYTPEESQKAMEFFYYKVGDRLWGEQGFYDAFNLTEGWVASSYLAIDQGPIIVMIENYRSQLLWELFMSCPEVQDGLTKLGFTY